MIQIEALRKTYRDFVAVDCLSLQVAAGEMYVVLGPNGAGKTTTIKCAVGLLHPTSGRIVVGGHDIVGQPQAAKRLIGYVPDRPYLYEKLTGAEFIRFMGRLYDCEPTRLAERAEHFLSRFRLDGWENELIESYSYGMRQKIVLTAVLARGHQVLVIDEPMVGLDPRAARTLREELLTLIDQGAAVILSTHSVDLAEQIASRIGIIDRGRLIAEGSMAQLRTKAGEGTSLEEVFLALTEEAREDDLRRTLGVAR